jgi:hypothetical protein
MPFTLSDFATLRPFLFHLTAARNLSRIRNASCLESAGALIARSNRPQLLRAHRPTEAELEVDGQTVLLRDQSPLYAANVDLAPGWFFEDLIELLNRRVFFWPGDGSGPIDSGRNHFDRYRSESPALLRCRFDSVRRVNPGNIPQFCRFNSGAPRQNKGRPIPRGPDSFVASGRFPSTGGAVIEVTFLDRVVLPADTEIAERFDGPWLPLFSPAG